MAIAIDLSGQTAWVTGGASGIGAGVVQTLVAAGARVVSLDRSHVPSADDGSVIRVPLDVRDSASVDAASRPTSSSTTRASRAMRSSGS